MFQSIIDDVLFHFSIFILVCEIYPTALPVHLAYVLLYPTPPPLKMKRKGGNVDKNLTPIVFFDVNLLQENMN